MKKVKYVIKNLPWDCWFSILQYIQHGSDLLKIITHEKELYQKVISSTGYFLKNTTFYVFLRKDTNKSKLFNLLKKNGC